MEGSIAAQGWWFKEKEVKNTGRLLGGNMRPGDDPWAGDRLALRALARVSCR